MKTLEEITEKALKIEEKIESLELEIATSGRMKTFADIQKKSRLEGELESLLWVTNYEI